MDCLFGFCRRVFGRRRLGSDGIQAQARDGRPSSSAEFILQSPRATAAYVSKIIPQPPVKSVDEFLDLLVDAVDRGKWTTMSIIWEAVMSSFLGPRHILIQV